MMVVMRAWVKNDLRLRTNASKSDSKIGQMCGDTSSKNGVRTVLIFSNCRYTDASFVVASWTLFIIPDLISCMVETEGSGWEVGNNIVIVSDALITTARKDWKDVISEDLVTSARWAKGVKSHPIESLGLSLNISYSEGSKGTTKWMSRNEETSCWVAIKKGLNGTDNLRWDIVVGLEETWMDLSSIDSIIWLLDKINVSDPIFYVYWPSEWNYDLISLLIVSYETKCSSGIVDNWRDITNSRNILAWLTALPWFQGVDTAMSGSGEVSCFLSSGQRIGLCRCRNGKGCYNKEQLSNSCTETLHYLLLF